MEKKPKNKMNEKKRLQRVGDDWATEQQFAALEK